MGSTTSSVWAGTTIREGVLQNREEGGGGGGGGIEVS